MTLLAKRPRVDHIAMAARLRANPGEWLEVGVYRSSVSAESTDRDIRYGYQRHPGRGPSPYAPRGSFESRRELTDDGVRITARYIGSEGDTDA